jgi:archaellum component FlaC
MMDLIESDVERFSIQIEGLESTANALASKAVGALESSIKALES